MPAVVADGEDSWFLARISSHKASDKGRMCDYLVVFNKYCFIYELLHYVGVHEV